MTEFGNRFETADQDLAQRAAAIRRIVAELPAIELLGSARVPVSPYEWGGQLAMERPEPARVMPPPQPSEAVV